MCVGVGEGRATYTEGHGKLCSVVTEGDALCAEVLEVALDALKMLEGMRRVLLCMLCATRLLKALEVPELSEVMRWVLLCLLEVLEVMYCVPLRMLEGVERGQRSLEVREAMGCATLYAGGVGGTGGAGGEELLYIMEGVESGLCSLEVLAGRR